MQLIANNIVFFSIITTTKIESSHVVLVIKLHFSVSSTDVLSD